MDGMTVIDKLDLQLTIMPYKVAINSVQLLDIFFNFHCYMGS